MTHPRQNRALSERIASLPVSDAVPAQVAVKHPKRPRLFFERTADMFWQRERVFGDQRRSVGAVLIVHGDGFNHPGPEGVYRGVDRAAQIQTDMVVANAAEQRRGVHRRTMFIVATDRIGIGRLPTIWTGF